MLSKVGSFVVRRRRLILVGAVILFGVSGALGGGVAAKLSNGGFDDEGSTSYQAEQYLTSHFTGAGTPNIVMVVTADPGTTVDDPAVAAAGLALTDQVAAEPNMAF